MAQQFKVLVNAGKEEAAQTLLAEQGAGQRGRPLIIKAKAGAKYQLVEQGKAKGNMTDLAPDNIKAKRVGKHLHLMFETDTVADVIIEDYYDVMADGYNGVIGKAENGSFYEYLTEDPTDPGLIPELKDNVTAVTQALGGAEVSPAGAAVAFAAFPLLGALGLLGGAAAVAAAANNNGTTTTTGTTTGKLDATAPNDSGVLGDNKTNNATPTLTGTVPTGSTATVTINGQTYPVTVAADGTWKFTNPTNLPDGTYYPVLNVTTNGVTTPTNLTPFTIDTTPPTVAVVSNAAALAAGETANITFTLSEPSSDFALDDIAVTGGTLSNLTQSSTDPKVYTATFTPSSTGNSATIGVASDKFADAAANRNTDGAEANNTVSFKTNATVTGALTPSAPNDSGALKDNLTNDNTPNLSGKVPAGSTATVTLNGKTYPAAVNPDGTWSAQIPDTDKLPDGTYTPQLNVTTGGVTTTTPITPFTIDTVPATVAVTSNASTLASGQTTNVTFTLSEPVADFGADDVQVTGGTLSNFQKSPTDPKVYTATFTPNTTGTSASITVPSDKFADPAANRNTDGAEPNNTVSLTTNALASGQLAPVSDNTTGVPNDRKTNDATPELVGKVPAGSTATVTLNGQTYPVTVAPDGTWTFTQPTNLPDGTYTPVLNVTTNGQTSSVPITPFTIDTVPPTVLVTGANTAALTAGQSTTLTFTVSEATTDLTDADFAVAGGTLGPLQQSKDNPLVYTATFTATPGTTANTTASVSVASDKFADAAGNLNKDGADTSASTTNIWSSTVTPATNNSLKTALTIDPIASDNVLLAGESGATTYPVTGKVTGTFAAGDVVYLKLNGTTYPAIVKADGTYSTLVPMTDLKADPDTKIEGNITPTGGDPATAAQDYTVESGNVPTQTALSIDPVTADNILGSTESTGNIALTGKVTGKFAAGDVVKLTVAGVTYSGTAAADGSYSIPVPAASLSADTDTQVDGTVTGTAGTVANAIQDYGVNNSVVPVVTPSLKTALTIDPITGDNVITATEGSVPTYTVTGKVTGTFAAGDTVTLTLNTHPYLATVKADGTYSVIVPMSDLKADSDTKIEGTVTGTGGDTATAAQDYTVETTNVPTQTALSIDPVTADNIIGSTESNGNIALAGKVTGKFSPGDIVKLTVAGVTYSGTAAADGSYSIPVPAAGLIADSDTTVDGTVTGTAGTVANAIQNYGVDANINPVTTPATGKLTPTAPNDSGTLGDNLTNDNTPALSGTVPVGSTATVTIGDKNYPVTVNPDGTWTAQIPDTAKLPDGTYYPVLNVTTNGVPSKTDLTPFTIDTVPPTVVVTSSSAALAPGQTATITFTLSEVSKDFVDGDIAVTGGSLGTLVQSATDPKVYTATFTPAAGSTQATISVISDKFSDAAANLNKDTATSPAPAGATYEANNAVSFKTNSPVTGALTPTAPNDSGTLGDNKTNDTTPTLNGTVPPGSTANVIINGQTYPVTVDPQGNWTFTNPTNLPDGTYTPELKVTTNGQTTTTPITPFTIDTVPPSVIVTSASSVLVSGQTTNVTFTLSEAVTDFASGDIVTTGGSLGPLTQSATDPKIWTAVFTPTAGSTQATISVASDKFSDAAANFNKDTATSPAPSGATYEANNQVTLTTNATASGQLSPTSDNSTGTPNDNKTNDKTPELTGKVPPGSTATVTINNQTYPVTVNPDGTWNFTQPVDLPDGTYTPSLNVTTNGQTTSTPITPFTIDTLAPTVAITGGNTNPLASGQSTTLTFTVSEATTNLTDADLVVVGGTLGPLQQSATNPLVYTASFTATADKGSVSIASDKFSDAAGNLNKDTYVSPAPTGATTEVNNSWNNTYTAPKDTTPPTIIVARTNAGTTLDANGKETLVFTLSEASTNFDEKDIMIASGSGTITGFAAVPTSGTPATGYTQYTAIFTPTPGTTGSATIGVASGKFADNAGNLNPDTYLSPAPAGSTFEANNFVTVAYDTQTTNPVDNDKPTVQISIDKTTLSAGQTATLSFILSEASSNFVLGDITVISGGGIVSNLVAVPGTNGTQYTATYTAGTSASPVVIGVAENTFSDAANNQNADTYKGSAPGTSAVSGGIAETNNWVQLTNTGTTDNTPPTVAVTRTGTGTVGATGESIVFTFSEGVPASSFILGDIDATGGTMSNLAPVESSKTAAGVYTQYSATYTPTSGTSGTGTIGVAASKFTDVSGNNNADTYVAGAGYEANNQVVLDYNANTTPVDTTPPTIAITADKTTLAAGQTAQITFTLSEASTNFVQTDVATTGGNLSNWTQVNATTYTATYTATTGTQSTGSVHVASNAFSDAAPNYNQDGDEANNTVKFITNDGSVNPTGDTTPPTIIVARTNAGTTLDANGKETLVFTLSEASTNFDEKDIVIANGSGTITGFAAVPTSGTPATGYTQYTAIFTPTPGTLGTATIGVASGKFGDNAGNLNQDTFLSPAPAGSTYEANNFVTVDYNTQTTNPVDNDKPTVQISIDKATLASGQTATLSFILSEASSNFVLGDITVISGGGIVSNLLAVPGTNGTQYTATYTAGSSASNVVIGVAESTFSDAANNQNADTYKGSAPGTSAVSGTMAETNNWVQLTNTGTTDTTPPTVAVTRTGSGTVGTQGESIVFTFSEGVPASSFTLSDIDATGGAMSNLTPIESSKTAAGVYTQYSATYTPTSGTSGTGTIGVDAAKFTDVAGNLNKDTYKVGLNVVGGTTYEANNQVVLDYNGTTTPTDTTPPTIAITADKTTLAAGQTAQITFTLSEASTNFVQGDVATTGGNLSNWTQVNATTYTATYTATTGTQSTGSVHVASNAFSDAAPNFNQDGDDANNTVKFITNDGSVTPTGDTTPPTIIVARTNAGTTLDANGKETLVFTLSEASTNFDEKDIVIANGSGAITGFAAVPTSGTPATGYTQYTAIFTPTPGTLGTATIGVASGKFGDNAGNLNQDTFLSPAPAGSTYEANNFVTVDYNTQTTNPVDNDKPTVQISIDKTTLSAGQTATLSFILSEASSNFVLGDITVISGGGIVSNLLAVPGTNGTQYTATYTAGSSASTVLIGVAENTFSDAAGNQNADTYKGSAAGTSVVSGGIAETNNWVQLTNTGATDNTPPTVAVTRTGTGTVGAQGESIVFTFSEGVPTSSFTLSDIDATGGAMSNLTPVESSKTAAGVYTQYSATYTPTSGTSGTGTIGVAATKFTDVSGNNNVDTYVAGAGYEANNQVVLNYNGTATPTDTTPPTIAITADKTTLAAGQTAQITFTLSEASTNFVQADVTTTGGGLSNWTQVNATTYTATYTATTGSQSTGSVHVASNAFSDAAPNYNQDGDDANNTVKFITNDGSGQPTEDTTPPTIIVARTGAGTLTSSETITFTLSEASKDFTREDITTDSGGITNFTPVTTSGTAATGYTQYTATYTPATGSGLATIGVKAGKFADAAANQNKDTYDAADSVSGSIVEANNKVTIGYNTVTPAPDTTPPTIAISRAGTGTLATGNTDTITFILSENSLTFDQNDVTLVGGSLTNWTIVPTSGSPSTGYHMYTATFVPATGSSGTATIGVKAQTFKDITGNNNLDTYDTAQLSAITGSVVETNNVVSIGYNTTTVDTTPPKVEVLRSNTGTITGPETIFFNFTEATTDFALTDITVSGGGAMSNLIAVPGTGNTQYIATYTPASSSTGTVNIGVLASKFSDAAGNQNADTFDNTSANYEANNLISAPFFTGGNPVDTTPPVVAITRTGSGIVGTGPGATETTATIVFTFSEPINPANFTISDLDVTNGAMSNLVAVNGSNNTIFTATFTPAAGALGTGTIGITSSKFTDVAGNQNLDTYKPGEGATTQVETNNQISLSVNNDTTTPTVTVTRASTGTVTNSETITFTLSEASATFDSTDVDVVNGSLSDWTKVSPTVYTATFRPVSGSTGNASVGVLADKFNDLGGNLNKDTYASGTSSPYVNDGNNQQTFVYDTRTTAFSISNDTATAVEAGAQTPGTNINMTGTTGVLANDSGGSLIVTNAKLASGSSTTTVAASSTSTSNGTSIVGQYGTLVIGADGSYTYTVNNTDPTVQALRTTTNTLTEVFTYTASGTNTTGAPASGTANLTLTITGTNDAPVAVVDTNTATEAGGYNNDVPGTNATGNLLSNDTDVDLGDNKVVQDVKASTASTATTIPGTGTAVIDGTHGKLTIAADGTYSYAATSGSAAEALRTSSQTVTDVFTYTVKDTAGATSTNTITITVGGANDAPVYVANSLSNQSVTAGGTPLSYQFATTAFTDVDTVANGETATYSATLSNNSPLPTWLTFNPTTRTFSGTPPADTPAGTITVKVTDTDKGNLTASGTFDIVIAGAMDTTPPTIAITSNQGSLSTGQTATITFTLSEASKNFTWDGTAGDIEIVGGGSLSALTPLASSGSASTGYTTYTATYTPATNSTTAAVIRVAAGKFTDAANLQNLDTWNASESISGSVVETNNSVTMAVNTSGAAATLVANNDTATAGEAGGTTNLTPGTNLNIPAATGILSNDTGTSIAVSAIKLASATSTTPVTASSTSTSNGTSIVGQYGTLVIGADGSYTYTVNNNDPTVQALRTTGNTLTEVFTYTASSGSSTSNANLNVTITGANDAPVAVADTGTATEAGGYGNNVAGTNASGNLLSNDTDVDTGDTKVVMDVKASSAATATAVAATGTTVIDGTHGKLTIAADGTYSYTAITGTAAEALRTSSQTVTDVFTYTVKDTAGLTHTNTVTISVGGANDAPVYVANSLSNQSVTAGGTALSYQFATTAFTDVDTVANGETATYTATMADPTKAWPTWLTFNPATRTFSGTPPANEPAGTITIKVTDTDAGGLTANGTFNIVIAAAGDTTPPTIAITTNQASLKSGQSATVTFTLSEASSDFTWDGTAGDIEVSGGALSAIVQSTADPLVYTATFTPLPNSTTPGVVRVAAGKFKDAANLQNLDTWNVADSTSGSVVETNNSVTMTVDTTSTATSLALANDTATAVEAGFSGTTAVGTNPAIAAASGVLANDVGSSPKVTGIQKLSDTAATSVAASSTSTSNGTSVVGKYGTLVIGADGSYTYTVNNTDPAVQALRTSSNTVQDVFTYTAADASGNKTAILSINVQGANDAPTVANALTNTVGSVGVAITSYAIPTNTFADVDSTANGETSTLSAKLSTGAALSTIGLSFDPTTKTVTGTPTVAGTYTIAVTDTDAGGLTATTNFEIVIADVLVKTVTFSSMTKDSGIVFGTNANWMTSDSSAGRLVSGGISATLGANEVVKVYANDVEIGNAVVSGTEWAITDVNGYGTNDSWKYTARVVNTSTGAVGALKTQLVNTDFKQLAPTILSVSDTSNVVVGEEGLNPNNQNPTTEAIGSVTGTTAGGALDAGSVIYLYDNSNTNLVGSAIVDGNGDWTVTGLNLTIPTNTFAARQLDVNGNESPLSNLWTVSTTANGLVNGNFEDDLVGFTSTVGLADQSNPAQFERMPSIRGGDRYSVIDLTYGQPNNNAVITVAAGAMTPSGTQTWDNGTWGDNVYLAPTHNEMETFAWKTFSTLASGKILAGSGDLQNSSDMPGQLWATTVNVIEGKTYRFSFDYWNTIAKDTQAVNQSQVGVSSFMDVMIDGQVAMTTKELSAGQAWVTYTATKTGTIALSLDTWRYTNGASTDYALDNLQFNQVEPTDGSLVPGSTPPATPQPDKLTYTGGTLNAEESNDLITVTDTDLQTLLDTGGGYINGGAGVDTLKLAAGTTLNLNNLTRNQTVQDIQQVEVFQLQGNSTLTLTANDVLSLGGSNATTMSAYNFSSSSGGTASASSTGKVQFVVNALNNTDKVVLQTLTNDAVLNPNDGLMGNTGLAGTWQDMGTTQIGSAVYRVYNHSTTQAQVLIANADVVAPVNAQAIVITRADSTAAAVSYNEEFTVGTGTTPLNTYVSTVNTQAWKISIENAATSANDPLAELRLISGLAPDGQTYVDTAMGTDGKLQIGLDDGGQLAQPRLLSFESKAGEFTAISFKFIQLNYAYANRDPSQDVIVNYYDADGVLVDTHSFNAATLSSLESYSYSLPAGKKASSFTIETLTNDRWFMDELKMTTAASSYLPHTSATVDTTPMISGTYDSNLNPGDVVKVYDNNGNTYLGDAVVNAATKTWTYQLTTPQTVGADTYQAKIVSSTNAIVASSNRYTLTSLISELNISAISLDSGVAGDFITTDNTIVYNGTLPQPLAANEKVRVQIFAADGTTLVRETTVTPASGSTTWTWDNSTATALPDGNYVIKATIVGTDNVTPVDAYGVRGTDIQPMTIDSTAPTQTVTITSMTKDSGISSGNADWTTADASAGRLVSGSISAALGANEVVKVYANGAEIGNATVSGTQWEITDISGYNANWTYTAKVVDTTGGTGPVAQKDVTLDTAESAVTISSVMETGGTTAITDGSGTVASAKVITTVNGTGGTVGDIVYVYDSSSTNLIGSATVAAGGAWSLTGLTLPAGAHTFAAVQRDALGNISPNSNLFKLAAGPIDTTGNMLANVTLQEEGGYSLSQSSVTNTSLNLYPGYGTNSGPGMETFRVFFTAGGMSSVSLTFGVSPDVQFSTLNDPTTIKFFNAAGEQLTMMQNGVMVSAIKVIDTTKTFNTGTFLNGQVAARMEISEGGAQAFTITKLGLTPGDTNTLTPTSALGVLGTPGVDGMTYNGGTMSALDGNDVITAKVATVQAQLAAGGIINGGAGVDTLKLQSGTVLDLTAITGNQTVKNIQEVEVFQMQGKSTLTMSANDVLSLGATELSGYSFAGSSTSSTGKVQLVVQGTATDKLNLSNLAGDALGSNTGTLAGEWLDKGTATIGGATYHVYDHSTTKAQVLVGGATQTAMTSNAVAISSMTLDTGTAGDFITSNGAAGRTVTGTIATALSGTDKVEVYANGVLIGNATVSGTSWTITDSTSHADNWTYTAKLVASSGNSSATTNVVYDAVEAAPVITSVTDSAGNAVASNAVTSGNLLGQSAGAFNAAIPLDNAFYVSHIYQVSYNGNSSTSTAGPMTVNPDGAYYTQYWSDGDLYDAQNTSGPGSMIEIASKNLVTVTQGQAYTMAFDALAQPNTVSAYVGYGNQYHATQIKWVLLDANGKFAADLTPWYSSAGQVENNASAYGEAIRLKDQWTYWTEQQTYVNNYVSNLPTGQYRVAMAYDGGVLDLMLDRFYFGVAKNPVNSVSGIGTVGSLIQLYENGGTTVLGTATVGADGTWTVTGLNLAAGTHNFTAKSTDGAGNTTTSAVYNATVTPVTLDLNGDGQIGYSQIKMDLNSDGILDTTSWVASQDGLLIHDMYGDGSVRENSQFAFARNAGETDLQGFAAQFDSNHDGVFDAKDAQFNEIAVWQDADQDGVADAGEVKHLADMGITSIKLSSDGVAHTPATGVTETGHTSAQLANGSTMVVADAAFDYTLGKADATVQADAAKSAEVMGPVAQASQDAVATEQAQAAAPVVQTAAPVAEAAAPAADAAAPAAADQVVDVTINELAPTGTEPVVLQPASALIQNKPFTLSPEQIAQFQAVVDAATAAAGDNAVDVTINELAPTGLEPLVFQHVLPINCEPSVMVPAAPVDAALPTDTTAVVDQQQPTHCDEPWLIELNGPAGTEPVVFNLNPASWNKPFELSAEQMAQLNLPVPADSNLANQFKLNVSDVLLSPADGVTPPALQINGAPVNGNTLNLSNLLGAEAAPAHLTATGTVQQDGQAFTFQVDATLQAMIDQQHLQHATMS